MEKIETMRKAYQEISLPQAELASIKEAIAKGKEARRRLRRKTVLKICGATTAAMIAGIMLLPMLSSGAAYAMSNVPVLGAWIETLQNWNFQKEENHYQADVEIPLLEPHVILQKGSDDAAVGGSAAQTTENAVYLNTTKKINAEMDLIGRRMVAEFEAGIQDEGYGELIIQHEILPVREDYFTLKLITFWGGGSGYEKDYFYTINLKTGKQLALCDLFKPGSDYVERISRNIKEQMRQQMHLDEMTTYWIDIDPFKEPEMLEFEFQTIDKEQTFYVDEENQVHIIFDEGEVAPMSAGTLDFVIPNRVLAEVRAPEEA